MILKQNENRTGSIPEVLKKPNQQKKQNKAEES